MNAITYLLQVSGCITLFYVFYYACLSRLTFFTVNRYYLVSALVLSFIIPMITIPVYSTYTVLTPHFVQLPPVIQSVVKPVAVMHPVAVITTHSAITWLMVLKWVYTAVCGALLLRFVVTLIAFFVNLRKQRVEYVNDLRIIHSDRKLTNGSFLNYIFLDDAKLKNEEAEQVIAHEILHVRLNHSVDRILGRLAQIVLWFNPVMYLFTRSIEQNHEFEVDNLLTENASKQGYAGLLLQLSVNTRQTVYNNFSKSPLQNRIAMLFNARSSKARQLVYLLVFPLVALSFVAFANLKRIVLPKALNKPVAVIAQTRDHFSIATSPAKTELSTTGNNISRVDLPATVEVTATPVQQNDTTRYSVIKGVENLGKNPLVLINDKEYPSDILYTIGSACIAGTGIWSPSAAPKYFGAKAVDGCVKIRTRGEITMQTPHDKTNIAIEHAEQAGQTFIRLVLQNDDGTLFDRVIERRRNGSSQIDVAHNAKVAFFIDSTFFTEEQIKKVLPEITENMPGGGTYNLKKEKMPDGDLHGYESVMYFISSSTSVAAAEKFYNFNWEKYIPIR